MNAAPSAIIRRALQRAADAVVPPGSARRRWLVRRLLHPARVLAARSLVRGRSLIRRDRTTGAQRHRLLIVLHDAEGGVRETTRDLLANLGRGFEVFLLRGGPWRLELLRHTPDGLDPMATWWFERPWSHLRSGDPEHRRAYLAVLDRARPDLVHVRHLLGHTDELVELCHRRPVPIVLSFHDYYMACPGIHLLDDLGRYCAGRCTPSRGQCRIPVPWLADLPVLKEGYLEDWRRRVRALLSRMDAFVTTSAASRQILVDVYPELATRDFRVIEHGRDFPAQRGLASPPVPAGPVRIAIPGHLRYHKGSAFLRRLAAHDRERHSRLELHFLGTVDASLAGIGIHHGPYGRDSLAAKMAELKPSFVGIFSIWPETWCHTLTEAWAMGVPVIATELGAVGERLREHGGGWTVPVDDVERAYELILRIADDPEAYRQEAARARLDAERTAASMGRAYEKLYRDVLASRPGRPDTLHNE